MSGPLRPLADADLHAFVDGQLDFERRAAVVQAMASDADLRGKVETWRRQNEALLATFGGVLREPLPLRLMPTNLGRDKTSATSASRQPPKAATEESERASGVSARVVAIAVAAFVAGGATVFVADALTYGSVLSGAARTGDIVQPTPMRPLAQRAYEAHRTYATDLNHAVEVPASDEEHLLKWIQHRLSMAVRIPDLRREGWTLVGGRILPGEAGPAAFLIYANGVERLGLYMARSNARQADTFSIFDNGAGLGSVGYWVDEPIGYAVTTNRDAAWLDRFGPALHHSIEVQVRDNAAAQ